MASMQFAVQGTVKCGCTQYVMWYHIPACDEGVTWVVCWLPCRALVTEYLQVHVGLFIILVRDT